MTRETKVGMIVAGSFLCLVCVVVASKLRNGDDPAKGASEEQTTPTIAALNPKQNTSPPEVKKAADNSKPPPEQADPAKQHPASPEPKPFVAPASFPPPVVTEPKVPDLVPPPQPVEEKRMAVDLPKPGPIESPQPTIPPPVTAKDGLPTFPMIEPKETLKFPPLEPKDVTQIAKPSEEKDQPKHASKDGPPTFPVAKDGPPSFPVVTPPKDNLPTFPIVKDGPPSFPAVEPKDGPPTFPALTPPKDNQPVTAKDGVPTFPALTPPKDIAVKDSMPTLPAMPKDNPTPPSVPPLGLPTALPGQEVKPAPSITIPRDPINPSITPVPSGPTIPPGPIPVIPSGELANPPNLSRIEPLSKPRDPNGKPMPIIRDTDIYVCQPGETNFAALSIKLYGTDKYAQALLRYNRDNYKATIKGEVFLNDTPVLEPGQQVHVAPVAILDRDYLAVRPVSTGPIPTIPSTVPTSPPLLKPTPINPTITAVSNPGSANTARTYVVQNPAGESILDIAERVLGDRGQWAKIWRVNTAYPPQYRIPVGTKLEIPPN